MAGEKTYLNGGGKEIQTEYGSLFAVSIDLGDAEEKGFIKEVDTKDGKKRYLNFTMAERKEPTDWGQTHYLYTKEYNGKSSSKLSSKATAKTSGKKPVDDLPF